MAAASLRPRHGARFLLDLVAPADPSGAARYRATVVWPDRDEPLDLVVQPDGRADLAPDPALPWAADVLRALARTLASSARATAWPRRLNRWRAPR
ncbi:MAG TPA: hypothetical protein VG389_21565 [Myxococcota bacterium]|jgi:hypothetical protein|nr:hypothetical protein [Myxococcota bacterium]